MFRDPAPCQNKTRTCIPGVVSSSIESWFSICLNASLYKYCTVMGVCKNLSHSSLYKINTFLGVLSLFAQHKFLLLLSTHSSSRHLIILLWIDNSTELFPVKHFFSVYNYVYKFLKQCFSCFTYFKNTTALKLQCLILFWIFSCMIYFGSIFSAAHKINYSKCWALGSKCCVINVVLMSHGIKLSLFISLHNSSDFIFSKTLKGSYCFYRYFITVRGLPSTEI